jgi:hypothetical protein
MCACSILNPAHGFAHMSNHQVPTAIRSHLLSNRFGVLIFWGRHRRFACRCSDVLGMALSGRTKIALQTCTLVLFGHTIGEFLDSVVTRDLDVFEVWAGVGSIVKAARRHKLNAASMEILDDSSQDVSSASGFMNAVQLVLSLKIGGLLWLAPVCSSFVWLSSSVCKRLCTAP